MNYGRWSTGDNLYDIQIRISTLSKNHRETEPEIKKVWESRWKKGFVLLNQPETR